MLQTFRFRFEHQITALVALLCIVLMGTSIGAATWIGNRDAIRQIREDSVELAGTMASALDTAMFERFRELQILAGLGPLKDVWRSNPNEVRQILETLQTSMRTYAWIGFVTPDGVVQAATRKMLEGASVSARPWFAAALNGPALSDVHEALLLSKLLNAEPYAEPSRFVDVSMPVFDGSHKFAGVLGAHLNWNWADSLRKQFVARSLLGRDADIWILSKDGNVLLGPKIGGTPFGPAQWAKMKSMRTGSFESNSDEDPALTGFASTIGFQGQPGLGWMVVARRPLRTAYAPVQNTIQTILVLSSLMGIVAIAASWFLARRIAAPIRRLTQAACQIGRDPSITTLPRLGGTHEFVELSSSLRSLLRRLGIAERLRDSAEARSYDSLQRFQQQIEDLRREASLDPLTGLLNRRAFLVIAEETVSYFKRYRNKVAILMIDIDHFKRVNDTHGHAAGDLVLKTVAGLLSANVGETGKVSRFGGDEFIIMLSELDDTEVYVVAEQMRAAVGSTMLDAGGRAISVTISIGAAVICHDDDEIERLIERADRALYDAKYGGRNRVSTHVVQKAKTAAAA